MNNCCNSKQCNWNEKFDISIANSSEGIRIDVSPKDKSKVESFQKLADSYKDFCGEDCC